MFSIYVIEMVTGIEIFLNQLEKVFDKFGVDSYFSYYIMMF